MRRSRAREEDLPECQVVLHAERLLEILSPRSRKIAFDEPQCLGGRLQDAPCEAQRFVHEPIRIDDPRDETDPVRFRGVDGPAGAD